MDELELQAVGTCIPDDFHKSARHRSHRFMAKHGEVAIDDRGNARPHDFFPALELRG